MMIEQTSIDFYVAVAGQPNTGKSTIFNGLTGLRQEVGNWAGKTVEKKMGKSIINGKNFVFIDLPGTYSLLARSEEEKIAVDYILKEKPDAIIVVVNAADLRRTLNYLLDIIMLEIPCILAVNMIDVAKQHGINVDIHRLEKALDIPCVELVASRKQGIENLSQKISIASKPKKYDLLTELVYKLSPKLQDIYNSLLEKNKKDRTWRRYAWKALEGDTVSLEQVGQGKELLASIIAESATIQTQSARFSWIQNILDTCIERNKSQKTLTERWDSIFLHPLWGYVCIAVILLFAISTGLLIGYPTGIWISVLIQDISSFILTNLPENWYILKALVQSIFLSSMSLICMIPLIAIFYFIFSFLEEIGYMPRVSFLMDSLMNKLGLNGMSFTPLLFALPCNIPGIIGVRTISTVKQRIHTLLLVPLVPCSSKIIVLLTLCAWIFSPIWSIIAACFIMFFAFCVFVILSIGLKNTIFKNGNGYDMLMELPQYHMPNFQIIGMNVFHHVLAFLKKASTIIFGFGIILWFLSYYPSGDISNSYLSMIGKFLNPIASLMGIDWKLLTSLMTSALSRETVLPTMALLYNVPIEELKITLHLEIGTASAISFLIAQFLSMPCLPSLGMVLKESGSWKLTFAVAAYTILLPITMSIIVYNIISIFV